MKIICTRYEDHEVGFLLLCLFWGVFSIYLTLFSYKGKAENNNQIIRETSNSQSSGTEKSPNSGLVLKTLHKT